MAAITSTTESWNSHKFSEVETHIKGYYSKTGHTHSTVVGSYTGDGGKQNPNYFGTNKVGFLMMNTTVNGNSNFKDWLIMDCYGGNDVGGGVAFGVNRQSLGAYIMRSASGRTSWAESAELIGTHNYTSYCATANHTHSSVKDSYNNTTTTFAYGKAGLDYTGYTWLAGWNGYELRAVDKTQFATAGHNHDSTYSKTGHTHSYLPLSGGTVTGVTNLHKGLFVSGRTGASGDDEGIVVGKADNGYAGLTLGSPSGLHSTFYLDNSNKAIWKYRDANGTVTTIEHPYKNGTIALTSDLSSYSLTSHTHSYLPLTGGTLTGNLTLANSNGTESNIYINGTSTAEQFAIGVSSSFYIWTQGHGTYIRCSGNKVGIHTSSPSYDFDVSGTGYYSSDLTLNAHLLVKTDKTSDIGSTSKYFKNVYQYSCHVWDNVNIGYQIGQLQADRAELTIISRTNTPADLIFGKSSTKEWQFSYRATGEINVYRNVTNTLAFIFDSSSNFTAYGGITALSDARHKEVVRNTNLTVEQIADMPSILFKWNDGKHDDGLHVGTLAQSWQRVLPEVVLEGSDEEKTLSFNYGVAALVSSITTARKVVDHEKEIKALKAKINVLEERISELEG